MLFESVDYQQHQRPVGLDRRPAVEPPVPKCLVAQPRRLAQSVGDHGGAVDSRYITSRDDEREREFGVTRACAEPPTERLPCLAYTLAAEKDERGVGLGITIYPKYRLDVLVIKAAIIDGVRSEEP